MNQENKNANDILTKFIAGELPCTNYVKFEMDARPENEKLARNLVASFMLELNPSVEELSDIKTAISEAVTNAIVHGYNKKKGKIVILSKIYENYLYLEITDFGVGIEDIKRAMQPFYTTKPEEERSGMGFTVMETFMDAIKVFNNNSTSGLTVCMLKEISSARCE